MKKSYSLVPLKKGIKVFVLALSLFIGAFLGGSLYTLASHSLNRTFSLLPGRHVIVGGRPNILELIGQGSDVRLDFTEGTTHRYGWYYDITNNRYALMTFDSDGSNTDGDVFRVADGDDVAVFVDTLSMAGGFTIEVLFCGQQANSGTIFMSPSTGFGAAPFYVDAATLLYNLGGTGCNAQDDGTEATADEVMFANNALKVVGMHCVVSSSGSNGVVLNLRDDTANLTPDVTITIATGDTTGAVTTATTANITAGSTLALRVINTEDLSAHDAWCIAKFLIIP